jgi:hypothetical protein
MTTTVFEPCSPYSMQITSNLHSLTNDLIESVSSAAILNDSYFVNEIPEDLDVDTDPQLVASVLGGMLSTVGRHARGSVITVSAKIYHDVILVHVKDYNNSQNYDIYHSLQELNPLAEKIGGVIDVNSYRLKVTTVVFSFPNLPIAA